MFYQPVAGDMLAQKILQFIGLSSGKVAHYLQAGLPVIVNRFSSLGKWVKQTQCGVDVADAGEIGSALVTIEARYDEYSRAACATFSEQLDYRRDFMLILSYLNEQA